MRTMLMGLALAFLAAEGRAAQAPKGKVSVLYAGSLVNLMENDLGPAFAKATGCSYEGEGKGSVALARMIKDNLRQADVFISADPAVNELLMAAADGGRVRWYALAFRNELVVGYNPKSRFAKPFALAADGKGAIAQVLQTEGLRLGRTDPKLDPKGYRTLFLFQLAEKHYRRPGLNAKILGPAENPEQVFPEEQLEARLETGQLDAGILYRSEAEERGLPFVALPREINLGDPALEKEYAKATYVNPAGMTLKGSAIVYTITILEGAPHRKAALAFLNFFFSEMGRRELKKHGLTPVKPAFTGKPPAELRVSP